MYITLDPLLFPLHHALNGEPCLGPCQEPGTISFNPVSGKSKIDTFNSVCPTANGKFKVCLKHMPYVGGVPSYITLEVPNMRPTSRNICKYILKDLYKINSYREYKSVIENVHMDGATKAMLKRCAHNVFKKKRNR